MHLVALSTLKAFWIKHPQSEEGLRAWASDCEASSWNSPQDIKDRYASVSFVGTNRAVFNICGNKYRLIVSIAYRTRWVFVKFVGTHADYDKVDAATVDQG